MRDKGVTRDIAREILPIPDRPHTGPTMYEMKDPNAGYEPIEPVRPPTGAPNILLVLLDDVGFGASSAFGGPCRTPVFERLAAGGLRYTRFHTTGMCSPTRQAMLTGAMPLGGWARSPTWRRQLRAIHPSGRTRPQPRRDPAAERLLDRDSGMPRGTLLGVEPDGPVRPLAHRKRV